MVYARSIANQLYDLMQIVDREGSNDKVLAALIDLTRDLALEVAEAQEASEPTP